jgi:hypothetical protein
MKRLSLILSCLALVISLTTAGSYASGLVNGAGIMNHTIGIGKLTPKAVKQLQGQRGARGSQGVDGAEGLQGDAGAAGATGLSGGFDPSKIIYVTGVDTFLYGGSAFNTLTAACPAGTKVISGGWYANIGDDYMQSSSITGTSYSVLIQTYDWTINGSGRAYAVCVAP